LVGLSRGVEVGVFVIMLVTVGLAFGYNLFVDWLDVALEGVLSGSV